MTKEEAIKKLEDIRDYLTAGNPIWDIESVEEACNMAIEALKHPEIIGCANCRCGEEILYALLRGWRVEWDIL